MAAEDGITAPPTARPLSIARKLKAIPHGTRVEVIWVDASGDQIEDGQPKDLGALQLLRSVGYLTGADAEKLVTARNHSISDASYRDTESIPVVTLVKVRFLDDGTELVVAKWARRGWIKALLG